MPEALVRAVLFLLKRHVGGPYEQQALELIAGIKAEMGGPPIPEITGTGNIIGNPAGFNLAEPAEEAHTPAP